MRIKIDTLDKLFSQLVKLLADGICEYCGKAGRETSHFHSRRKRSVRYDRDNACFLCFSCHRYLDENPYVHTEFFKKRLGSEKFEQLNIRAELIIKITQKQKNAIKADLKEKIRLLEGAKE